MLTLFSVGLPLFALAALIPACKLFESLLNRFPRLETAILKAAAFNVFEYL